LAILKVGGISKYLSQPLLRGFTTAAACQVLSTQIKHIIGVEYPGKGSQSVFKIISVILF
jgi:MFS superfamily sulfate permease-like transporter